MNGSDVETTPPAGVIVVDLNGRNLVFVHSTPRAGSTLLGAMLGAHTQVLCPAEPWLLLPLEALCAGRLAVSAPYDHRLAQLAWRQWGEAGLLQRAARDFAVAVYAALLAPSRKTVLVDKTPRYYYILPWLKALLPEAKRVWLKRNPLDVVASYKDTWRIPVDETMGHKWSPVSVDTTLAFEWLVSAFATPSPAQYIVRYEDVVHDPAREVSSLCDFVGLEFEPAMVEYGHDREGMQALASQTLGDRKVLEHSRPHELSVGRWRHTLTSAELRDVLLTLGRDLFDRLGYGELVKEAAERAELAAHEITARGRLDEIAARYREYLAREAPQEDVLFREHAILAKEHAILANERATLAKENAALRRILIDVASSPTGRAMRRLGLWRWFDRALARLSSTLGPSADP